MTTDELFEKAQRALVSAQMLFADGDFDGACNRAYYAMFDAARAALIAAGAPMSPETARTHRGLIAAFSLCLVKNGPIPVELGKALNRVADLRLLADYSGEPLDAGVTRRAVNEAVRFVAECRRVAGLSSLEGDRP